MSRKENLVQYFRETGRLLGCQFAFDAECFMFISNQKDTGRGNIEIFNDGSVYWFFTLNTNTTKEKYVEILEDTPEWFREIYCRTITIINGKKKRKSVRKKQETKII